MCLTISQGYYTLSSVTNTQYQIRLWILLAVYALLLAGSLSAFNRGLVPASLAIPFSLVPMVPGVGILLLVMARYRAMDELAQRMQTEAITFAFGATAILTFSYGFLENTGGAPPLSFFWVWPIMAGAWLVGTLLARLRYR